MNELQGPRDVSSGAGGGESAASPPLALAAMAADTPVREVQDAALAPELHPAAEPGGTPTIVGIGASAGGLDAFIRLLRRLPSDAGVAVVLVQHLNPSHESLLPEILGREAAIPVVQAEDGSRILADHAYVIPPNTTMTVTDGHLRLVPRESGPVTPIDALLSSLAEVHGSNVVGVILSGAGSDGTRGIQAIKEVGGLTMAQDDVTAAYPSMPRSAVATGAVDFVLTPEEIAEQLIRVGRQGASHPPERDGDRINGPSEEADMRKILALLQRSTGIDFQHYRRGTVHRRVLRRMLVHHHETRKDYFQYLRENPDELEVLREELLIGVTTFFRDPDVFAALQQQGFPALLQGHRADTPLRVWVAGCSGGEEAYSIAIALSEFLADRAVDLPVQIFGTDLSDASITTARAGLYPDSIRVDVSPERLRRFFVQEDGGFRIGKSIRDLCVFSRQDITRDPPFSHLDLISCRNVLIYLEPVLQRRIFPTFHYALDAHGLLLLGSAESPGATSDLFVPLDKRLRIYRRAEGNATRRHTVGFTPSFRGSAVSSDASERPVVEERADLVRREADRVVRARYESPGVVIDEHFAILQFRGDTAPYLAPAPGMASLSLLKLVRSELRLPIQVASARARTDGSPTREGPVSLGENGRTRDVVIEVVPFDLPADGAELFVVLFDVERGARPVASPASDAPAPQGAEQRKGQEPMGRNDADARERYLQAIVEQHESALEELRAANEEIQSSNEELQSTNEELETTKEEVQSTNEELITLNEELRHRNREQSAIASDLANFLASTTIPIVIVSSDLRLRRFTPASNRVMRIIPSDVGRPLNDIKLRVPLPDIERQIQAAVETLSATEDEVRDEDGHWWSLTIRPYKTVDQVVDGAVLVFSDIDASKRYGERVFEAAQTREHLLKEAEDARGVAERAKAGAELANKAKGDFLTSMSHDLRTPLNAITGYTQLMGLGVHGPVTEAQRVDIANIERSSRHLLALITDILNFAKVEAGRVAFDVQDVPAEELVVEIEEMIAPQVQGKLVPLERGRCGEIVHADPEKVRQILFNLLSNAAKFTDGNGRLGMRCDVAGNVLQIEVWDTGVGIPADQLSRIFEPFVQVGRGLSTPSLGGVGLGLTISRDLARGMGGDLTVRSAVGEGSTFTLTLPRAVAL